MCASSNASRYDDCLLSLSSFLTKEGGFTSMLWRIFLLSLGREQVRNFYEMRFQILSLWSIQTLDLCCSISFSRVLLFGHEYVFKCSNQLFCDKSSMILAQNRGCSFGSVHIKARWLRPSKSTWDDWDPARYWRHWDLAGILESKWRAT